MARLRGRLNNIAQMNILLAILAVAFAAFSVWLTVRIVNRRERWAKRTAVAVIASPMLYMASFGPACWISSRTNAGSMAVSAIFRPILWGCASDWVGRLDNEWIRGYTEFGADRDWHWVTWPDDGGRWRWTNKDHGYL